MGRWDPPPPSGAQRFLAAHTRVLQLSLAVLCLGSFVVFGSVVRAHGLGTMSLGPLLNAVACLLLIGQQRNVARMVTRYDEQRGRSARAGSD